MGTSHNSVNLFEIKVTQDLNPKLIRIYLDSLNSRVVTLKFSIILYDCKIYKIIASSFIIIVM